jgi:excisionase family DNA binding protein
MNDRAAHAPGAPKRQPQTNRLALTPDEAAAALGVSRDFLDQHILPELRTIRRGRRRLIPIRELERWLDQEASRPLERRQGMVW